MRIVEFILRKKATNPVILEIKNISHLCDYFVICSGVSGRQVRAIYEEAIKLSKVNKINMHHTEDDELSKWLLIDYFDVILHIFYDEAREFYGIERIWREAKKIKLPKKLIGQLKD